MKRYGYTLAVIFITLNLWGCGNEQMENPEPEAQQVSSDMRNVEERDYATILIIEKNDDEDDKKPVFGNKLEDMFEEVEKPYHFVVGTAREKRVGEKSMNEDVSKWECETLSELAKVYNEEKGKDLSLAHLKVIFLVEEDNRYFEDEFLLEMLEQDVEIAKTVPMLLLEDEDDFLEYLEDVEEPVGNYVENLIKAKNRQGSEVSTVADYLRSWREGEKMKPNFFTETAEGFKID